MQLYNGPSSTALHVEIARGHDEVLEKAPLLEELALRCDQAGTMHFLQHFFAVPTFRHKTPCLVLGFDSGKVLQWSVLLHEIAPLGLRVGLYTTDDISGFRAVVSRSSERSMAAAAAADSLLQDGAHMVRISYLNSGLDPGAVTIGTASARWATQIEEVRNTLLAQESYESTLRAMGKATRFNMRYYRRRLTKKRRCEFVADARGLFGREELLAVNESSRNPFSPELAWMQYESSNSLHGGFLSGLRTESGLWLGLVGGWRQGRTTVLLWQMNRSGFDRDSIGTVMRSYFVEHEIESGAERVVFYGGTPNSIQHSFRKDTMTELLVVRRSLWANVLLWIAKLLAKPHWWLQNPRYLAAILGKDGLEWRETTSKSNQLK